jgi:hypothetical protein
MVMSQLVTRLEHGHPVVGTTLEQLPAMLALDERNSTVRALCVELARVTDGRPLQWRMVRLIGPAVGQDEAAVDAAIAYAVERDWLIAAGNPPHSICLTDAGRDLSATPRRRAPTGTPS